MGYQRLLGENFEQKIIKVDDEIELRPLSLRHARRLFNLVNKNKEILIKNKAFLLNLDDIAAAKEYIKRTIGLNYGVYFKGRMVGEFSFHSFGDNPRQVETCLWLDEKYRGRGISPRITIITTTYAFEVLKMDFLLKSTLVDNLSCKKALDKAGFIVNYIDNKKAVYIMSKDEWLEIQKEKLGSLVA